MKYQSSIDQNNKYKHEKKIEKERLKKEQQLQKKIQQLQEKRRIRLEEMKQNIENKYQKELKKYINKQYIEFEKLKRKIEGKKPLKKYEKKESLVPLKKKLYELVQKYVRLRDSDSSGWGKCISCGKKVRWDKADGGHYISRSNMSTAFDHRNVNLQCKHCNGMLHGNLIEYRKHLLEKIGAEQLIDLEKCKYKIKNRTKEELEKEIDRYTILILNEENKKSK